MRVFGLLGKTLKHSFSKAYFTTKFEKQNISNCSYENFELESIIELPHLLRNNPFLAGLNVTIPYKEEVIPFLHSYDEIVGEIKACNCIKIVDGELRGFNTDVIGFQQSLEKHLQPHHNKALVLGTGGAAKAVLCALQRLRINYTEVSRSQKPNTLTYDQLKKEHLQQHTMIINTTPAGMYPNTNDAPSVPYDFVTSRHLLFDLIYNPEKTLFLKKGEEKGATIINGAEMLLLQAEESWRIWNS